MIEQAILDVKKQFGSAVKRWRNRLGISQGELATRAGLHRTYVSDIERGTRNPSLENIEKLADALQISTPTLFTYETFPSQIDPQQSGMSLRN
ncbi:MAG TPA: helix-turn-helix transcriptional regulator [Verrucomicrobiae bacterium]|jgi:transcriptional regulator with XRE-family HTH domain|nr:helix-turn-helix transcriptional regulator [Verrucomicrobiae bacterium]